MALDPRIILAGQPVDVMGAVRQGNAAAAETNALRMQNDLTNLYKTQGAQILAGDAGALNALAGFDPMAAMDIQAKRQDMTYNQRRFEILNAQEQRAIETFKATKTAAEAQAAAAQIEDAVKMGLAIQDPAQWDAVMAQQAPELVGQFANRQALAMKYMTMAEALKATTPAERPAPLTDAGKTAFDVQNGWITQEQADAPPLPDPKAAADLRKEFSGQQLAKNFAVMSDSYGKIAAAAKDPSAAGDLALIFSFMKMLDPTSVVREQEFANAQNAAGVPERVRATWNNLLNGERLTASTRADFLKQTDALYSAAEQQYAALEQQYRELAQRQNLPENDVLLDYRFSGARFTPPPTMGDLEAAGIGTSTASKPGATTVEIDGQTYTIEDAE